MSLVALHDAAGVVAFDKPAGLLTVPGREASAPSLWRLAEAALGARLWAVHRLDRETSGLVVFARDPATHRALSLAFEHREVVKRYLARVAPPPLAESGELRHLLVPARRGFMRVKGEGRRRDRERDRSRADLLPRAKREGGWEGGPRAREGEPQGLLAITRYEVLRRSPDEALVALHPLTGRTHQLRLQLATLGSPIVGEPHYRSLTGARPSPSERLWLHAQRLELELEGRSLQLEAPVPAGFELR